MSPVVCSLASRRSRLAMLGVLLTLVGISQGCASSSQWVSCRAMPRNPLADGLQLVSRGGPKPTPRTEQILRRYDLAKASKHEMPQVLQKLIAMQKEAPSREVQYSISELAYVAAKREEVLSPKKALTLYGTSLVYAYQFLFDTPAGEAINPYDPQFRGACDLYNQSLEATLRIVQADGGLRPGQHRTVETVDQTCSFDVVLHSSRWHAEDVDNLKFVSDYQLAGLRNHYHTYGLGVPLIAERREHEGQTGAEQFYPDNLTFPLTAFLRVDTRQEAIENVAFDAPAAPDNAICPMHASRFVLELHDPLDRQQLQVAGSEAPLESDLSLPLAYFLNQPKLDIQRTTTLGLLHPGKVKKLQGLYMLEPYDPHKMPVVMVHGLWSSPVTWMEMFNDLRSDPAIREHYQFWFYLYPTGQPFWVSAAQMRQDLAKTRLVIDPTHQQPALDQMVLVGHSMGGLVSRLQSVDSGNQFWATLSDHPFEKIEAEAELKEKLGKVFFFQPNPSVRRVVTLGTPHRGSRLANGVTEWIGNSLIHLPKQLVQGSERLLSRNRNYFRPDAPLGVKTSLDSLDPNSVVLAAMQEATPAPWISYHNILGRQARSPFRRLISNEGDGVVSIESARLDGLPGLRSQLVVEADHLTVHSHPQSILEMRRILLEQLAELKQGPVQRPTVQVVSGELELAD